ncbi:SGNH/GDSL hydrolase family protein [Sphingopyxis macrogoltabida]|uniref:Uncharacterized protein n=1 Tax=Sphingopyxis macrogoltabida TaxID=33050 RepID=A0AAC9AVR5_SPHMC|nr:hypothetical protein [Sphingopyxis macrogoltabida]ALJ14277.1 hypothetical protein LH19_15510 [Sphingopyxis macrogoltabida]AMU90542.1 hypothetical protein ATM17_16080 [Sphingopyxis macrogoltabida]
MGVIADKFEEAFRDFTTAGVMSSGRFTPDKALIRALGMVIESQIVTSGLGFGNADTEAGLPVDGPADETSPHIVFVNDDPDAEKNGPWVWRNDAWEYYTEFYAALANVVAPLVAQAQAWAEGNDPGGPGTKSAKQWHDAAAALVAVLGDTWPLKPPAWSNALRGRYGIGGASALSLSGSAVQKSNIWSQDIYDAYGEPNVIEISGVAAAAGAYTPEIDIVLSVADLARIGIIPDDVAPPTISLRAAIMLSGLVNQNITTVVADGYGQVAFALRYDGANGSTVSAFSAARQDIVFYNNNAALHGSGYNPPGNPFAGSVGAMLADTGRFKGYKRSGFKVYATLNGKALTHLKIKIFGRAVAEGAYTLRLARLAVVAGSVIDDAKSYIDREDKEAATVSPSEYGFVTVQNASKVGVFGNSFSYGQFNPRGKNWIAKASAFTDYNFENLAISGDTVITQIERVRAGRISFGNRSAKDFGLTYAMLVAAENDPTYERNKDYADDIRAFCQTARSINGTPIIATEWLKEQFGGEYQVQLHALAAEFDGYFLNLTTTGRRFDNGRDLEFWGSGHPGVRTNHLFADPVTQFVRSLPRPRQSLKIFRRRPSYAVAGLDDLVYDSHFERAQRFMEIDSGHNSMVTAADKYMDALATSGGAIGYASNDSEYLKLQAGVAVAFADYATVDAILPGTDQTLDEVALLLSDPSVTVYVRDVLAAPYESAPPTGVRYERFTSTGNPAVVPGDTYTSDDAGLPGAFTIVGKVGAEVLMSPMDPNRAKRGAGTLTRTGGSGAPSITYTAAMPGAHPDYYTNFGKPEGHWVQVVGSSAGVFTVTDLRGRMQVDRIQFLIYKVGGFSLSDVRVRYKGASGKPAVPRPYFGPRARGKQLLAQTLCGTVGQLANWTVIGALNAGKHVGDNVGTPVGTTGYVTVNTVNKLKQAIAIPNDTREDREIEIRITCRRWVEKVNSGTYPVAAPITGDSFDWGQLQVELIEGGIAAVRTEEVGLHWKEVTFRCIVPAYTATLDVQISGTMGDIDIAEATVSFVAVDDWSAAVAGLSAQVTALDAQALALDARADAIEAAAALLDARVGVLEGGA